MKFVLPFSGATALFLVFVCGQLYNRLESLERKVVEMQASNSAVTRIEYRLQTLQEQVQEIREAQKMRMAK